MNKRLKLALKNSSSQQGFAIPIAVGMGLIMILIATTMIVRSQGDQISASAQKATAQSLNIAEGGIARTLSSFNLAQARPLLKLAYDPKSLINFNTPNNEWNSFTAPPPVNSCDSTSKTATQLVPLTNTIGSSAGAGTYNLLAYRYDSSTQTGTLLMKGSINNNSSAQSQIKVVIPVREVASSDVTPTSLMAEDINLQQTDVTGNITCSDRNLCPLNCSSGASEPTLEQLRAAIGATSSNAVITNPTNSSLPPVINVGSVKLPAVPAVPAGATVISLGNVSSNLTIPSAAQITAHTAGTPYYFSVNSINKAEILIRDSITDPVYFYITGNIEQQGNNDIRFQTASKIPSPPGQIRIYGANTSGTLPTSQTFEFGGNACTMAFIHAPNADIGIDGGGNGCSGITGKPNIYGAAWVKTFNVSVGNGSNSAIFVEQPNLLQTLASSDLVPLVPKLENVTTWQRQEVTP